MRIWRSGSVYVCLGLLVAGAGCSPRAGKRPLPALVGEPAADSTPSASVTSSTPSR